MTLVHEKNKAQSQHGAPSLTWCWMLAIPPHMSKSMSTSVNFVTIW